MKSNRDAAPMSRFRPWALFGLLWRLLVRFFRGGQDKVEGSEVRVEAAPDPLRPKDLSGPQPAQRTADGTGPLFYRHYSIAFSAPGATAEELMRQVQADPNEFSPPELAVFRKTRGASGVMREDDEFFIEITGPWNGPVRVIRVQPTSFSFATLQGHMEAGEIRFELKPRGAPGAFVFDIFSWARSKDALVDLAYDKLKVAKGAQTEMWTMYCENVVKKLHAEPRSDVKIETKKTEFQTEIIPVMGTLAPWKRYEARLQAMEHLKLNFELTQRESYTTHSGWSVDEHQCVLPPEKPGVPEPNGAFNAACAVLATYEFPDPAYVRGIFKPDAALGDRIMLLEARFLGIRFYFGVKIGVVVDEVRETPDGQMQVWGYSYRTLEGHFERGEIFFEIGKHLKTGEVHFHISAYSRPDRIRNLFYRLGFRLFGRSLQKRFARTSLERMQKLVANRLRDASLKTN